MYIYIGHLFCLWWQTVKEREHLRSETNISPIVEYQSTRFQAKNQKFVATGICYNKSNLNQLTFWFSTGYSQYCWSTVFDWMCVPLHVPSERSLIQKDVLFQSLLGLLFWSGSEGGRFTLGSGISLEKACLASIPLYYLSLFTTLVGVANHIEKLTKDFLWSGVGERNRDHLVRWDLCYKPKEEEWLGIEHLDRIKEKIKLFLRVVANYCV